MKQQVIKLVPALILIISAMFVLALAVPAYAVEGQDDTSTETTETEIENESSDDTSNSSNSKRSEIAAQKQAEIAKRRADTEAKVAATREEVKKRLETKSLELCQKRETKVQEIIKRTGDIGDKHLSVIGKIATRTQDFYTSKGLSLANYGELVGAVETARLAAEAQVAATKAIGVDFKCDSEDPLGTAAAFKASIQEQKTTMKAYKTAVKNLIVGVKSVVVVPETATDTTTQGGTTNE